MENKKLDELIKRIKQVEKEYSEPDNLVDMGELFYWLGKCKAALIEVKQCRKALIGMIEQFGYETTNDYYTGGLSTLEEAFEALGFTDTITKEEMKQLLEE